MKKRSVSIQEVRDFLSTGIWRIRAAQLTAKKSFLVRQMRIFLLAVKGFRDDRCQLRASALTFYSLLSVVPIVAMAFGVAKGFGFEKRLEKELLESFPEQQDVAIKIIGFAQSFLENTQGGLIAGVGVALLFWAVIKVLGNIESSFNDIWGVKKGRSFGRKLADYLSVMLIAPILLVMASSMTVMISSQITAITEKISLLGAFSSVISTLLKVLPYGVIWALFTFLYVSMPNTRVKIKSGLFGGIVAGTVYQVVQWIYINFQIGVSSYGAIYGSFAALPLFLVWLQISWLVVFFGAEIAFAEQNVDTYEFEPDSLNVSHAFKRTAALRLTHLCVKDFQSKQSPKSAEELAGNLELPIRLVRQVLFELTGAGILSEIKLEDEKSSAYQPARAVESLTIEAVVNQLDQRGINAIPVGEDEDWKELDRRLDLLNKSLEESPDNLALKDL